MPMQHEVFPNPDSRNRRSYPYVAVMQADMAGGERRIVAPLAPRIGPYAALGSRGAPRVSCAGADLVLVLPLMGTVPATRLKTAIGSLAAFRDDITRALDWLFFGV